MSNKYREIGRSEHVLIAVERKGHNGKCKKDKLISDCAEQILFCSQEKSMDPGNISKEKDF